MGYPDLLCTQKISKNINVIHRGESPGKEINMKDRGWIKRGKNNNCNQISCYYSVTKSCLILCGPMNCSMPSFSVFHHHPEFALTNAIESVMPSSHLNLCSPLLLLSSIFPSIRVFTNESALHRWPKYWNFSFSIIPSSEYSELIFFRIDGFDLLAVQGTLKSLFQHHSLKASNSIIYLNHFTITF